MGYLVRPNISSRRAAPTRLDDDFLHRAVGDVLYPSLFSEVSVKFFGEEV